jgi:hypothetical protein
VGVSDGNYGYAIKNKRRHAKKKADRMNVREEKEKEM